MHARCCSVQSVFVCSESEPVLCLCSPPLAALEKWPTASLYSPAATQARIPRGGMRQQRLSSPQSIHLRTYYTDLKSLDRSLFSPLGHHRPLCHHFLGLPYESRKYFKSLLFQVVVALVYLCIAGESMEDLGFLVGHSAHRDAQSLPCKMTKFAPNTLSASQMSSACIQCVLLS